MKKIIITISSLEIGDRFEIFDNKEKRYRFIEIVDIIEKNGIKWVEYSEDGITINNELVMYNHFDNKFRLEEIFKLSDYIIF